MMTKAETLQFAHALWDELDNTEWRGAREVFERAYPFDRWNSLFNKRTYAALYLGAELGLIEREETYRNGRKYVGWRRARWPPSR